MNELLILPTINVCLLRINHISSSLNRAIETLEVIQVEVSLVLVSDGAALNQQHPKTYSFSLVRLWYRRIGPMSEQVHDLRHCRLGHIVSSHCRHCVIILQERDSSSISRCLAIGQINWIRTGTLIPPGHHFPRADVQIHLYTLRHSFSANYCCFLRVRRLPH